MEHRQIVHRQPTNPPVSVRKGVGVLKLGVEICCGYQHIFRGYIPQFFQ